MSRRTIGWTLLVVAMVSAGSWGWSQDGEENPFGTDEENLFDFDAGKRAADKRSSGGAKDWYGFPAPAPTKGTPTSCTDPTPSFLATGHLVATERIEYILSSPLPALGMHFKETPLSEVIGVLSDEYNIDVLLDTQALDDLGLTEESTITIQLRHITLRSALTLMLKQHDLTYIIDNEVLLITSEDEALSRLTVKVYPVGDLLQPREGDSPKTAASVEDLIDALYSAISQDTWAENGGMGDIRPLQPGLLVVSQTQEVHEEIAQLLCALRQARAHDFARPYQQHTEFKAHPKRGDWGGGGGTAKKEGARDKKQRGESDRGGGGAY